MNEYKQDMVSGAYNLVIDCYLQSNFHSNLKTCSHTYKTNDVRNLFLVYYVPASKADLLWINA